jgi:hypothetical protein
MNGRRREIALLGGRFGDDMDPTTKTNGVRRAARCRAGLQPADRLRVWTDTTRARKLRAASPRAFGARNCARAHGFLLTTQYVVGKWQRNVVKQRT